MKKTALTVLALAVLLTGCAKSADSAAAANADVQMRVQDGYIQYYNGTDWENLIATAELKGDPGEKGDKGDKGDTGNGISAIEIAYNQSASNTIAPTAGWVATPPSVAAGSYLWTRLTITMTEGSPVVAYTIAKQGVKGDTGAAAGFGTPTATIDGNVGTPTVTVTASGENISKVFNFAFKNMKGERGEKGDKGNQGTIFTPSVSSAGVLSWTNDGGAANPESVDLVNKTKEAIGGFTFQKLTSAPSAGTSDSIITLVVES